MNVKKLFAILSTSALSALVASQSLAGSFTSNFSDPNQAGFILNGGVLADGMTSYPAIENGRLVLTYPENSLQASIVLDDLDGGAAIEGFTATFKLQIGPGSGNAADGLAFCFGPDITSSSMFNEDGTGNGVIVAFDIYDNGGGEAPAIDIKYGGQTLATTKFTKAEMVTSNFEDVAIEVTRSGTLSLTYKGQKLYDKLLLPGYAPAAGQFAIGGRTGGENANQWIDDLKITTVVAGNPVQPSIAASPQSQTVNEGSAATFSFSFDGSAPLTFQWLSNNVAIAEATSPSYTIDRVPASAHGARYKCTVSNDAGSATSQEAILTVNSDQTPPTLVTARGSIAFNAVTVNFSEPMDAATAQNPANYQFSGGLTVSAATLQAAPKDNVVVLTTSKQAEGARHTLTVSNVKDAAGNLLAANSQTEFRSYVFMTGAVLHKKYNNFDDGSGGNPENLFNDPRYPNAPDRVDLAALWEYPADGAGRNATADPVRNYFDTLEGYFIPPTSGNYVFLTAGADRWWLYLSTDDSPANAVMIAGEPGGWSNPRGWVQAYSGSLENRRSDQSTLSLWPEGPTVHLTAGQRYYMLEVHHDPSWCGADDFSATYKLETEDDPADGTPPRLAGSVVGTYVDPTGAAINFARQPASLTQEVGRTAVFSVGATGTSSYGGTVSFQWQRQAPNSTTWANLDAKSASYETPVLTLADNGSKYRVVCSVPGLTENSAEALLTVVTDTAPPQIAGAGAIASQSGNTFDVGVSFNEAVDQASASALANYSLSAGTISNLKFYKTSPGVVLTVSGLSAGNTYTLTVKDVADVNGNKMASTSKEFKVSAMKWGVVGGNELQLGNGVLATAENGFDVYSDGIGEWASYDEATFVYEEVTGNFDKVLRVEYQDASSQWARAGLVVREETNFGVDRGTQESGAAGRYQKVHVNPVLTAMGTPGNNAWEGNRRLDVGGATSSAGSGGVPKYPNAWCRLQRSNDVFIIYRSDDGLAWTELGRTTFPEPMPAKLYVGPEFSPENGNIGADSGLRDVFVAKIRDYGNYPYVPPVTGANIAWVSFHPADNDPSANAKTAGFTEAPDVGYTRLLAANGHQVTRIVTSGTPDVARLNTFDLVIISRSVPSGDYQDPPETLAWNGITAPTMLMGGYILRNSRLGYTTGGNIPDTTNASVRLSIKNPAHPIFAGVALDADNLMVNSYANLVSFTNLLQRGISVNTDPVAGGGAILATIGTAGDPAFGGLVIGEWPAGAKMGNAAGDTLGGRRLVFLSGSREQTISSEGAGIYDLTGDGAKMFLNAVNYMTEPVAAAPKITSITRGADGKLTVTWEGGGTLQAAESINGPWQDVPDATSPYTLTPTAQIMFGRIKK